MVSSADEKGLSHKPRHRSRGKRTGNIGHLMGSEWVLPFLRDHPEFSFFERWGYPLEELFGDQRASEAYLRLGRFWPRLTPGQRRLYLRGAEIIAQAEKAKRGWNPKGTRERSIRLVKSAVAAARLVEELSFLYPPPWVGEQYKVGELVFGLASYVRGAVDATEPWDRDEAVWSARGYLREAKKTIKRKTGGMRWELFRDLVWLASGKTLELDERDVRRYLDKQRSAKNPAEGDLRRNWDLIGNACLLAKQWRAQPKEPDKPKLSSLYGQIGGGPSLDSESYTAAALSYLKSPSASNTSR